MNTSFETEAELALQHLPNGLLVVTKGSIAFNDKLGKTYLVEATGTGITLASGNIAVEQPSASVNEALLASLEVRLTQAEADIITNAAAIAANAVAITNNTNLANTKLPLAGGTCTGLVYGPDFVAT